MRLIEGIALVGLVCVLLAARAHGNKWVSAKWTLLREASPGAGVEADISTDPVTYWPGSNHVMRAMPLNDTTFICGGYDQRRLCVRWNSTIERVDWLDQNSLPYPLNTYFSWSNPKTGFIYIFGGEDPGFPTSTFYSTTYQGAWNGSTLVWTQIHAGGNPKPAARVDGINWIDTSGNLWLWGGRKINGNPDELNELWVFDVATNTWVDKSSQQVNPPSPREVPASAYAQGFLYIYGGSPDYGFGYAASLWRLNMNGLVWTRLSTGPEVMGYASNSTRPGRFDVGNFPPGRFGGSLIYHPSTNCLILFAGLEYTQDSVFNDMWAFDLSSLSWAAVPGPHGLGTRMMKTPADPYSWPAPNRDGALWTTPESSTKIWHWTGRAFYWNPIEKPDFWSLSINVSTINPEPAPELSIPSRATRGLRAKFFNYLISYNSMDAVTFVRSNAGVQRTESLGSLVQAQYTTGQTAAPITLTNSGYTVRWSGYLWNRSNTTRTIYFVADVDDVAWLAFGEDATTNALDSPVLCWSRLAENDCTSWAYIPNSYGVHRTRALTFMPGANFFEFVAGSDSPPGWIGLYMTVEDAQTTRTHISSEDATTDLGLYADPSQTFPLQNGLVAKYYYGGPGKFDSSQTLFKNQVDEAPRLNLSGKEIVQVNEPPQQFCVSWQGYVANYARDPQVYVNVAHNIGESRIAFGASVSPSFRQDVSDATYIFSPEEHYVAIRIDYCGIDNGNAVVATTFNSLQTADTLGGLWTSIPNPPPPSAPIPIAPPVLSNIVPIASQQPATSIGAPDTGTPKSGRFELPVDGNPFSSSNLPVTDSPTPSQNSTNFLVADSSSSALIGGIVGAILFLLLLVGLLILFLVNRRRLNKKKLLQQASTSSEYTPAPSPNHSTEANLDFDSKWIIDFKLLTIGSKIGSGAFGVVYAGEYDGEAVAIKQCNLNVGAAVQDFKNEAKLMLSIKPHPSIVRSYGISMRKDRIYVILELCDGGSLDKRLKAQTLSKWEKVTILASVARGLAHLHRGGIVHRDVAARNVLLTSAGRAKVSDFGMARLVDRFSDKGITTSNVGPIRWMAPECIRSREYSFASDVWAYAILCIEVWTGELPHKSEDLISLAIKIRDKAFAPVIPANMPKWLVGLLKRCWASKPLDRPNMQEVLAEMSKHDPEEFPPSPRPMPASNETSSNVLEEMKESPAQGDRSEEETSSESVSDSDSSESSAESTSNSTSESSSTETS